MLKLFPIILFSQLAFADLADYAKEKCQSAAGWNIIQKLSNDSYLVEFSTSRYGSDDCVRNSPTPGGCYAVAVLKTLKPFSTSGKIAEHLHVKKIADKINLKKEDGFEKSYQIFQEDLRCAEVLKSVNKSKASQDPIYDCNMNGNAESCFKAGMKAVKEANYLTMPWHMAETLWKKHVKRDTKRLVLN